MSTESHQRAAAPRKTPRFLDVAYVPGFISPGGRGFVTSGSHNSTARSAVLIALLLLTVWTVRAARSVSAAPSSVTNAAELTTALRSGGAIELMPCRYVGNFVISVDGTRLVGRATLPDARVQPAKPRASRKPAS